MARPAVCGEARRAVCGDKGRGQGTFVITTGPQHGLLGRPDSLTLAGDNSAGRKPRWAGHESR